MAVRVTIPRSTNAVTGATHRNALDICKLGTGRKELRQHRRPRIFVMRIMRVIADACSHVVGAARRAYAALQIQLKSDADTAHRLVVASLACEVPMVRP